MYCIKCGVELGESERKCPLCHTPVYYPDLPLEPERTYPKFKPSEESVNPRGVLLILSFVFLIAGLVSLAVDLNLNSLVTFSGYVISGLVTGYVIFILPSWFKRSYPTVFLPVDFLVIALLVGYISYKVDGSWYFTFALPVIGCAALIICTVVILCYYVRRGYLYIFSGAFMATALMMGLIELFATITFRIEKFMFWSIYPFIALMLIGIMLLVIAIVKPFRESLKRIFAI